jgi:hypothetical protein
LTTGTQPPPAVVEGGSGQNGSEPVWKKLVIGAAAALIAAVIGRAVGIIPNPFAGDGPGPSGSISLVDMQVNQTQAMFHGEQRPQRPDEAVGLSLTLQRASEHTAGHGCRVVWSYVDPTVPAEVSYKNLVDQEARGGTVDGDPTACSGPVRIWTPRAPELDTYPEGVQVRVDFFAGDELLGKPAYTETVYP